MINLVYIQFYYYFSTLQLITYQAAKILFFYYDMTKKNLFLPFNKKLEILTLW